MFYVVQTKATDFSETLKVQQKQLQPSVSHRYLSNVASKTSDLGHLKKAEKGEQENVAGSDDGLHVQDSIFDGNAANLVDFQSKASSVGQTDVLN